MKQPKKAIISKELPGLAYWLASIHQDIDAIEQIEVMQDESIVYGDKGDVVMHVYIDIADEDKDAPPIIVQFTPYQLYGGEYMSILYEKAKRPRKREFNLETD